MQQYYVHLNDLGTQLTNPFYFGRKWGKKKGLGLLDSEAPPSPSLSSTSSFEPVSLPEDEAMSNQGLSAPATNTRRSKRPSLANVWESLRGLQSRALGLEARANSREPTPALEGARSSVPVEPRAIPMVKEKYVERMFVKRCRLLINGQSVDKLDDELELDYARNDYFR